MELAVQLFQLVQLMEQDVSLKEHVQLIINKLVVPLLQQILRRFVFGQIQCADLSNVLIITLHHQIQPAIPIWQVVELQDLDVLQL